MKTRHSRASTWYAPRNSKHSAVMPKESATQRWFLGFDFGASCARFRVSFFRFVHVDDAKRVCGCQDTDFPVLGLPHSNYTLPDAAGLERMKLKSWYTPSDFATHSLCAVRVVPQQPCYNPRTFERASSNPRPAYQLSGTDVRCRSQVGVQPHVAAPRPCHGQSRL